MKLQAISQSLRQVLTTESTLKMMENAFDFNLKALFILKIFKFLSWPFSHVETDLTRKIRLISKFMTAQLGKQTSAVHILLIISRTKGNQTMKFGQLIEYQMNNNLLQNHTRMCWKIFSRTVSEKSKLEIYVDFWISG